MATKTVVSSEADNPDDPNTQYVNVYSDGTTDTSSSPLEIGSTVGSADSSSSSNSDSGAPSIVNSFKAKDGSTVTEMSDGTYQQDGKTIDEATYNQLNTEAANAGQSSSIAGSGTPSDNSLSNLATQVQNLLKGGGLGSAAVTAGLAALAKSLGGGSSSGLAGGTTGVYRGYQGGIPTLTAARNMNQIPAGYRPGGGGLSYFSPVTFTDTSTGKVVPGVAGSGSPMNVGDATGNVTGPTSAGALTSTNSSLPGGITTVGSTAGMTGNTTNNAANSAALAAAQAQAAAAQQQAQQQAAQLAALQKQQADQLAAQQAAAAKTKQQQTDIGNIVAKYPNPNNDPTIARQMQVALAQYADANGLSPTQFTNLVSGQSYASNWSPATISNTYKAVDPLAQVVSAYQNEETPAQVNALAAKNNISLQDLTNYGLGTSDLNNLAAQGYLPTSDLTQLLAQNYNAGTPAGIAAINNIAKAQNLTAAQVQQMYPGIDLNTLAAQGIVIPGYTPTNTAAAAGANTAANTASGANANSNIAATDAANFSNFVNNIVGQGSNNTAAASNVASTPVVQSSTAADPILAAYQSGNYSGALQDIQNAGLSAQDVVTKYGLNADQAAQVAQNLGYTGDLSNLTYGTPAVSDSAAAAVSGDTTYGANGGILRAARFARGGYAQGGISSLGTYSDGGRMLKGPGDGVSDSIPAMIGGHQKAALADGEFVIPARIVSEIGNGSSDAGARKLYAMMDRIQQARKKTTKNVAANTRAEKYLPG